MNPTVVQLTTKQVEQTPINKLVTAFRTTGYESPGDGGGALFVRVESEPSHPGKVQSYDGAWWEMQEVIVTIEMFGGGTNKDGSVNDQAIADAIAYLSVDRGQSVEGGPTIQLLYGDYEFSSTIQLKKAICLRGMAAGHSVSSGQNTRISFPADTTGIIVHRYNTINDEKESDNTSGNRGADNAVIENLTIVGGGGETPMPPSYDQDQMNGHGIWLRARAILRNLYISGFARNGVHIRASAGGADHVEGNANLFYIDRVAAINNGWNGFYVDGPDVNAGVAIMANATNNGLYGIFDSSFLGNTWIGCHTAANNRHGQVHYDGNRYVLVTDDPELGAQITPGTDDTVWLLEGPGGVHELYPNWSSDNTYVRGGPYRADSNSARCVFVGCYAEGSGGRSYIIHPNLVVGGLIGAVDGGGGTLLSRHISPGTEIQLQGNDNRLVLGELTGGIISALTLRVGTENLRLQWDDSNKTWDWKIQNSQSAMRITMTGTTVTGGRSEPLPSGMPIFPRGLWVGSNPRYIGHGTGAPASGEYARGDIILNRSPSAGGNIGWVCVSGGTPGTWKAFGNIEA